MLTLRDTVSVLGRGFIYIENMCLKAITFFFFLQLVYEPVSTFPWSAGFPKIPLSINSFKYTFDLRQFFLLDESPKKLKTTPN